MKHVQEPQVSDRLLALAGTLKCDVTDIEGTMSATMRKTSTNQPQESEGIDRLLALAGTLECEVTDIGERHNDYIGDAPIGRITRRQQ